MAVEVCSQPPPLLPPHNLYFLLSQGPCVVFLSQPAFSLPRNPPLPSGQVCVCVCVCVCVLLLPVKQNLKGEASSVSGSSGVFDVFTSEWRGGRKQMCITKWVPLSNELLFFLVGCEAIKGDVL